MPTPELAGGSKYCYKSCTLAPRRERQGLLYRRPHKPVYEIRYYDSNENSELSITE